MKNNIVLRSCGFDKGFDMDVISKLRTSLHTLSFARDWSTIAIGEAEYEEDQFVLLVMLSLWKAFEESCPGLGKQ
jgi:hypothetical protein